MHRTSSRWKAAWALSLGLTGWALEASAATFVDRTAHSATLLPDGNILIVGGQSGPDQTAGLTGTGSVQISLERQGTFLDAADLPGGVSRSSHTATLLPNGRVLVAGGISSAGTVLTTGIVYDPVANSWAAVPGAMSAGRFHHTATLLKNGTVLICGGQTAGGGITPTCDLFTPVGTGLCATSPGCLAAATSLSVPRSAHTATLISDGRVLIAGGFDPGGGSDDPFLVTTEIYTPTSLTSGFFSGSKSLIARRAFHTATLLGNGKVLIAGGMNAKDEKANRGILDTAEIYDPLADSMIPAASMLARTHAHTATLDPDGSLKIFGGLGNITTTFLTPSLTLVAGSSVTGSFAPVSLLSTMTVTGGYLSADIDFTLSVPVSGAIETGEILFSTPQVSFPGGIAFFTPGSTSPALGLRANLAGTRVYCPEGSQTCGRITRNFVLGPLQGQYFFSPLSVSDTIDVLASGSTIAFTPSGITVDSAPAAITGGYLTGSLTLSLPAAYIGGSISSGTIRVNSGSISAAGIANISITDGFTTIPGGPTVVDDGFGGGEVTFTAAFQNLAGLVSASTDSPVGSPLDVTGASFAGWSGTMRFVVDRVDLSGELLSVDVATVIVRGMMFGDLARYNPQANLWSFAFQGAGRPPRFGHTATLSPNGDIRLLGGLICTPTFADVSCPSRVPNAAITIPTRLGPWTPTNPMPVARGNHTSTLLPNGKILLAGGTNGPSVLRNAHLFDPVPKTYSQTGAMREARDLHTATLLPNGRVLVAGGFTTNAVSTGATSGSEIYFPETGVWLPARSMAAARDNHAAVLLADGNVLVAGGYNGGYLSSAEIYVTTSGVWRSVTPMNLPRALHAASLLRDGRILVTGGVNATGVLGRNEIYNPATDAWTLVKCLNNAADPCAGNATRAHSHRATLLPDGRVLVTGGNDGSGEVDYSLVYDPAADAWTNTAVLGNALNVPRFNHTASLLPNGAVLVAGGAQKFGNSLSSVETFSTASSSWQITGGLNGPRAFHTAVLAPNGSLFAAGGANSAAFLNTTETIYFAAIPDSLSVGAPPSARQSSVTAVDLSPFDRGGFVSVTGQRFQGTSEASGGGSAGANSSHFHPRLLLQAAEGSGGSASQGSGGFLIDLTTRIYANAANSWSLTNSSITVEMPPAAPGEVLLPYGWYHLRTGANAQYSDSLLVQAGPPKPGLAPGPVTPTLATITSTTIVWNWTSLSGLTPLDGYEVFSATSGIFITTIPAATPSFTQTGLVPNTTAQVMVAAYTLSGDGPLSFSATFYTLSTAPVSVALSSVSFNSLRFSWDVNGNAQGTVYEVSSSTDGFATSFSTPVPTLLNLTTDNVLIDFLQSNTTYFFRVRAFNGAGIASNFSTVVSTRTRAPVLSLAGTALETTVVQWSWVDPGGVNFYKVYNATTGAVIATPNSNLFLDVGLATNTARAILVSAVSPSGEGPLAASATVFTLAAAPALAEPPILDLSTGSLRAQWLPNGNPLGTAYELFVSSGSVLVSTVTTTGLSTGAGELSPPAALFQVQVRALNQDSIPSAFLNLGSTATLANPPASLQVLGTSPSSISVAWGANGNSPLAVYQVTASTDNFATSISTSLSFAANSNQTSLAITGLPTSTTFSIRVQARNTSGQTTNFSNIVTTITTSGGAPLGSVGGTILEDKGSEITGTLGDGRFVRLSVPGLSFSSDLSVVISSFTIPPSPCPGGAPIGVRITVTPQLQPVLPLALTLSYTDAELGAIPPAQVALMRVDASGRCVPLKTAIDTASKQITAQLNHLSQFQLAQVSPAATPEAALLFPNPFLASQRPYLTLSQVPALSRVRIFTLRGELVFEDQANASGLLTWNGRNRSGRRVASGIYLVVVESDGSKKILKLAVLR